MSQGSSGEDFHDSRFWLDSELMEAQLAALVRIKSRNPFMIELRSSVVSLGTHWVGNN